MRNTVIVLITVLSLSLFGLIRTKLYVQTLNGDIKKMEDSSQKLHEQIKVLRAEWAYLNKVDRLESLSAQYLDMTKISTGQIKKLSGSEAEAKYEKYAEVSQTKKAPNWKYKSRNEILKVHDRR